MSGMWSCVTESVLQQPFLQHLAKASALLQDYTLNVGPTDLLSGERGLSPGEQRAAQRQRHVQQHQQLAGFVLLMGQLQATNRQYTLAGPLQQLTHSVLLAQVGRGLQAPAPVFVVYLTQAAPWDALGSPRWMPSIGAGGAACAPAC